MKGYLLDTDIVVFFCVIRTKSGREADFTTVQNIDKIKRIAGIFAINAIQEL